MLTGGITAVLHYLQAIPLNLILIGGVFFCSFLFVTAAFMIGRFQRAKHAIQPPPAPSRELPAPAAVKEPCPDEWLHAIAQNDKNFIDRYVKVIGCEVRGHDLLHTAPYVDFKFTILNASVYLISIDETVKGDIYFGAQLLSKDMKMVANTARYCKHGESKDFTVRQWLSREEVAYILSAQDATDQFRFSGLDVTVTGASGEQPVNSKKLDVYALSLSSKTLRESYPKLEVEIKQATFRGYLNWTDLETRGLLFNMHVRLSNPRPTKIEIQSFRLAVRVFDKTFVKYAEVGEIYEKRQINAEGKEEFQGNRLKNLNPSNGRSLTVEREQACDGWLQFIINDVINDITVDEPDQLPATLAIIDSFGEEHRAECMVEYKQP